ncbi:MAG: deoxyhypusine synthase family protein [Candidatus Omnitrophica bacterium]|nr:deoxyhypusine synthase family protein [Candidatus Omnitrophota bacterium]
MDVKEFIKNNFKHFNAATLVDASEAWIKHLKKGGKMFLAMGGAMSTGEIGISLSEIIRKGKVHGICCTGANLEEDIFNLIAHDSYKRIPHYRQLTPQQELELRNNHLNRVTDTCIPEEEAIRKLQGKLFPLLKKAEENNESYFPFEYIYQLIRSGALKEYYQIDPKNSWVVAACEKAIPILTPGWEDSTLGNRVVAEVKAGRYKNFKFIKSGLEQMSYLVDWYLENTKENSMGFFQIGGGIAGDFPICVVPLIKQDLKKECKFWGYFCQISDSTTSYGSYSGAVPNEKITWEKLDVDTPKFIIESDASIVVPLIFQYILSA